MSGYKGRYFNREQIYFTGAYMDGAIYPVYQPAGKRRRKCRPTSSIQAKLNQRNAEKKLVRIVHLNFSAEDLAVTVTFRTGEEPKDEKDAQRIVKNYLQRLRRLYRKLGLELKYIYAIEYGGKKGRCHCHLIISGGVDRDLIEDAWGLGYANTKHLQLDPDTGLTGLSKYTVKDKAFYKRWVGSRNLVKPEPAEIDGQISMDEVKELAEKVEDGTAAEYFENLYPGYRLVEASVERNAINHGIYIRFEMAEITGGAGIEKVQTIKKRQKKRE